MQRRIGWLAVAGLLLGGLSAPAEMITAGRVLAPGQDFSVRITAGQISEFNAVVQETRRKLYDVMDEEWKQDRANRFDLDDFNVTGSHPVIGLSLERNWKYVTLLFDATYVSISSDAVAQRDYFLSVDKIEYEGVAYEHLVIRDGTEFSFDINGAALEFRFQITPFTLHVADTLRVTPFLDLGLFGFAGHYDIDAGESSGVIQYQNPVENFVVGGKVDGLSGLALPEYGGGLDVRIGHETGRMLVIQGHYVICRYSGGTSFLTSSSHREKNLDIDHRNARLRVYGQFPLKSGRSWMLGAQYQQITSDGSLESQATDPEEIIARRERFDKEFAFRMKMTTAFVGMTF